jgi:RNA polymerase sigma-70 factor, ECF subfamily
MVKVRANCVDELTHASGAAPTARPHKYADQDPSSGTARSRIFLANHPSCCCQHARRMDSSSTNALVELVRRAQKGDEGAQRELVVAYQHRVAGFIYAMTGRSDYVEDLAQQVFIKMIRAVDRLEAPAQFESWLFRLARNTCIDQLRRQKLRRIFLPFGEEHENIPEPPGAVDTEELDALRHALAQLRPQDRALLALVQEGRSHAEIAETLSTSVAAVKARLHRAREHLREHYQPQHED